jgi:ketosteroid isomerase-like protein
MSANLDLVRSIYEASAGGDFGGGDWADREIEYVIIDGPSPGTWKGPTAMAKAWREILSAWDNLRVEAEEFRELDGERVLVLTRSTARGKRSGIQLPQAWTTGATVWQIRAGKVTRHVVYLERTNALVDLGLEQQ